MRQSVQENINVFITRVTALELPISCIILFGSQARGTAVLTSDIDLAIVSSRELTSSERALIREQEIPSTEIDLFFTSQSWIDNATHWNDPNLEIKKEGVKLWPV